MAVERSARLGERVAECRLRFPLLLVTYGNGPLLLRVERDLRGELRQRPARAGQDREHLERGDDAVAGGGVLTHDDVAALLAAQHSVHDDHAVEDVLVADGRPRHAAAGPGYR